MLLNSFFDNLANIDIKTEVFNIFELLLKKVYMKTHKEKIDELISLEKENNLFNHVLTSLFKRGKTIAEKKMNEYVIWTTNHWVGSFYPIFRINFNQKNEIKSIKTEMSLNGKLWSFIFGGLILSFFVFALIIPMIQDFEYLDYTHLIILVVYGMLAYLFYWTFRKIYLNETKYLLNELKITVGLDSKENIELIENTKKEWTLKMTLFRLFAYPFSLFIIFMSIYMISIGSITRTFGIIVPIGYLYTDIKIIIQKRKKRKK